jgi:PmbA protein
MTDHLTLLHDLVSRARAAGVDAADAVLIAGTSLSVQLRLGKTEHVERSEGQDLGLRVFIGQKSAIVSSTTIDSSAFPQLIERAMAMARVVPDDPYAGLAETAEPPRDLPLDLDDPSEPEVTALETRANAAEQEALAVQGVTNSEGAGAGYGRTTAVLVTSAGFAGSMTRTSHSVSATALAGTGTNMQRDYDYHTTVYFEDLDDPVAIGRSAGERAVARLNPARPATARLPIIYDPRVAGSLLGHLTSAINGAGIARGTSFLKDKLNERVFAPGITVHEEPHRVRGLRSRVFDGEGTPTAPQRLIDNGVLTTWLLDSRSARQLSLRSNGHAARGTGGPPSPGPSNIYLAPGSLTPQQLMADIKLGLYVTEMIGMGINGITGDYSRGAAGFMIRDGAIAEPVAEITIAGNLIEMFAHLTPANDLRFRYGTDSPTVRVEGMTLAGA